AEHHDGVVAAGPAAGRRAEPDGDAEELRRLVTAAGSVTERAYLVKAIGAGHGAGTLREFAAAVRGRDAGWLHHHLTLLDRGGPGQQDRFGVEVDQFDPFTCGTTSAIVARAEADPVYALALTRGLEPPYDARDREEFDRRLSAEQRRVHRETTRWWPRRLGTLPAGVTGWLDRHVPGVRHRWRPVDDTDPRDVSGALRDVLRAVDAGHAVPVLVGGAVPRHYVLVVGHSGADLLIFEPTSGDTVRATAADVLAGRLAGAAGFDHVQAVVLPSPVRPVE
ncbi:MAG TPA: hypothetical protein VGD43_18695, partial [Micromonospora sp.]